MQLTRSNEYNSWKCEHSPLRIMETDTRLSAAVKSLEGDGFTASELVVNLTHSVAPKLQDARKTLFADAKTMCSVLYGHKEGQATMGEWAVSAARQVFVSCLVDVDASSIF